MDQSLPIGSPLTCVMLLMLMIIIIITQAKGASIPANENIEAIVAAHRQHDCGLWLQSSGADHVFPSSGAAFSKSQWQVPGISPGFVAFRWTSPSTSGAAPVDAPPPVTASTPGCRCGAYGWPGRGRTVPQFGFRPAFVARPPARGASPASAVSQVPHQQCERSATSSTYCAATQRACSMSLSTENSGN